MTSKFTKLLLFVMSYFPLYILLTINNFKNWSLKYWYFWLVIIILISLSIFAIVIFLYLKPNNQGKFESVEPLREDVLSYLISYVVPLLYLDIKEPMTLIINCLLFIMIGFTYVLNNLIHLNPMLNFLGYKLYSCEDNILISRLNHSQIKTEIKRGNSFLIREISTGVKIITKIKI